MADRNNPVCVVSLRQRVLVIDSCGLASDGAEK